MLLQLFDEGRLSDSDGNVVDFRNTIIICTSNLGSQQLGQLVLPDTDTSSSNSSSGDGGLGGDGTEQLQLHHLRQELGLEILKTQFPPEFVNRLDEVVVFNALSYSAVKQICSLQLQRIVGLLAESHGVELEFDHSVCVAIANSCYGTNTNIQFGARPIKRMIQREVLDSMADLIIEVCVCGYVYLYVSIWLDWYWYWYWCDADYVHLLS